MSEAGRERAGRGTSEARRHELGGALPPGAAGRRAFARLEGVLDAVAAAEGPPVPEVKRRAQIQAALEPAPRRRMVGAWMGAGFAVAAAVALVLWLRAAVPSVGDGFEVLAGTVERTSHGMLATHAEPARVRLRHGAEIEVAPGSQLNVHGEDVALRTGSLRGSVKDVSGQRFTVRTDSARVEILGARFQVRCDARETTVEVFEGEVTVRDHAGIERRLKAGERLLVGAGLAPVPATEGVQRPPGVDLRKVPEPSPGRAPSPRRARPAQLNGDSQTKADAELQRAEDRLAAGHYDEAVALYEGVSVRHPDPAERETALFAAASLAARHDPARARSLLQRYLTRHPAGRYVTQVQRLLAELR